MARTSIDDLKGHLFDVLERLKAHDDADVDPKDTISLETAAKVVEVSKVIVECYKVQTQALKIVAETENPVTFSVNEGLISSPTKHID